MTAPQWAVDTMHEVWADQSDEMPVLVWRRSHTGSTESSGHCWWDTTPKRIVVTAGQKAPRWEQKQTLLHELAHAMCPTSEHHGDLFWFTAWTLYRRFKLPIRKVKAAEEGYRKGSNGGYLATRSADAVAPAAAEFRWEATCPACGKTLLKTKKAKYYCSTCFADTHNEVMFVWTKVAS